MIFVTGSTGRVGSELIATLQARGVPFRALAHSPASVEKLKGRGVDVVTGDLLQPDHYADALEGVEALFLLAVTSPTMAADEAPVIAAAQRAGIKRIVRLSAESVDNSALPMLGAHAEADRALIASGMAHTILRPNYFMQNFNVLDRQTIQTQNAIYGSMGAGRISMIDTRDIADVAAAALLTGDHDGQIYTLTGREALTFADAAAHLSAALGRTITYMDVPPEMAKAGMMGAGMPEWYADGLLTLFASYARNEAAAITSTVEQVTGHPARTFADYATAYAGWFAADGTAA
jgi:uncharacterized protein YbjT (DUF2867 family)